MFLYTKDQLKAMQKSALEDLVGYAGGRAHLSRMLNKPLPTINSWIKRGMVSEKGAEEISLHPTFKDDFPVSRLRPDL